MLLAARSVASKAELVQIFLTRGRRSSNKVSCRIAFVAQIEKGIYHDYKYQSKFKCKRRC